MMKLTVAFLATLLVHLMAVLSGVLVETTIFFSAVFDSLSECQFCFLFFPQFFESDVRQHNLLCALAVHGITESMCRNCRFGAQPYIKNRQRFKIAASFVAALKSALAHLA